MRLSHLEVLRVTFKRFGPRLGIVLALAPALSAAVVPAYCCSAPIGRSPGCTRYDRYGNVAGTHQQQLASSSSSSSPSTHFFRGRVGRGGVEAVGATTVTVQEGAKRSAVRLPDDHLLRPAFQKLEQMLTRYRCMHLFVVAADEHFIIYIMFTYSSVLLYSCCICKTTKKNGIIDRSDRSLHRSATPPLSAGRQDRTPVIVSVVCFWGLVVCVTRERKRVEACLPCLSVYYMNVRFTAAVFGFDNNLATSLPAAAAALLLFVVFAPAPACGWLFLLNDVVPVA